MRRFIILLSLLMVLLTACAPIAPVGANVPQEEPVDDDARKTPEEEPAPGSSLSDTLNPAAPEEPSNAPFPELVWDDDPENVVISATYCCGFVPRLAVTNYIPDATIFGDGRIVWTVLDDKGGRQVFVAQLSPEELEALLSQIVEAGFFGWQERYADLTVSDLPDQCLQVNLADRTKSVCEYSKGAPVAFHEIYDFLAGGVELTGELYVPEAAYLTVENLGSEINFGDQKINTMDEATLGFSLEKATNGVWIEGEALAQLWQEVNTLPWLPVVEDGQAFFQIGLQVPGLSLEAPPQQ